MTISCRAQLLLVTLLAGLLAACGSHKQARVDVPPPPAIPARPPVASLPPKSPDVKKLPSQQNGSEDATLSVPANAVPLLTENGMASWYGAPYHNRRSSNGEVYNMNAMTAAHRTLPLGSIVRVTNVKTGSSALLKITDRGPFVDGRIIDVSYAAAKQLDIWQPGVARVKLEVMQTPASIASGGRWAVQIGSFGNQKEASDLAAHLARRYQTAKVDKFLSPVGDWWVRVRVLGDDRQRAEALAHETETREGSVYVVRLD
ncbi:MAG TPA: septal ring lytic transglycosylase RlpA family protein [Terriglobales bacterium]|nr:septal ring lytic transglycosylase RlpA family protein [Terriglobales bacterium]